MAITKSIITHAKDFFRPYRFSDSPPHTGGGLGLQPILEAHAKVQQLIIESRLLIIDAEFIINCGNDTLNLPHGKHAAQESVTGIMTVIALIEYTTWLIGEGHAMIYSHRQSATRIALAFLLSLLEDAAKFNEMAATTQMRSLCKVAVREDVARAQMNKMSAVGKLLGHCHTVVVLAGRE